MILSMWLVVVYVDGLFQLHAHWTNQDLNRQTKNTSKQKNCPWKSERPKEASNRATHVRRRRYMFENLLVGSFLAVVPLLVEPWVYVPACIPMEGVKHWKKIHIQPVSYVQRYEPIHYLSGQGRTYRITVMRLGEREKQIFDAQPFAETVSFSWCVFQDRSTASCSGTGIH